MADNIAITPGSGSTVRTDDVGGIQYQVVKFDLGGDGVSQLPDTNSGSKSAGTLRVVLATDQPALTTPMPVADGGGSITVDGTVTATLAANVTEDVAAAGGETSVLIAGVRNDAAAAKTSTDGDFGNIALDSAGRVGIADLGGTITVDAPAASPIPARLADASGGFLTIVSSRLAVDPSGVTSPVSIAASVTVTDSQVVADNGGFTDGTTKVFMGGYIFDEVAGTALTENDAAAARVDSKRAQVLVIEDATTRGQRATVSAGGAIKVDGSAATQPVSGTVTTSPPSNASTNVAQLAGTTTDTNSGNKSAGTLRVVLATDQPALTNKLLVTPDANAQVDVNKIAGTATAVNSGNKDAGTQRVVLATDQPALTNPLKTTQTPATTGGLTTYHLVSAATTNATNIKASAGQVFGWYIYNSNAAARKVAFHNSASAPTAGASIFFAIVIPPSSGANVEFTNGIAFSSGIGITTVTDLTDAGATAVAASDLIINIFYS